MLEKPRVQRLFTAILTHTRRSAERPNPSEQTYTSIVFGKESYLKYFRNSQGILELLKEKQLKGFCIPESAWGRYISLKDLQPIDSSFQEITGSIKLPGISKNPLFSNFFTSQRTYQMREGMEIMSIYDRGANYYAAIDPLIETAYGKMEIIRDDVKSALLVIDRIDRSTLPPESLPFYLGVLDYIRNGFLISYNALTFNEKSGRINKDPSYNEKKDQLEALLIQYTRIFYQTCLGREYDSNIISPAQAAKLTDHLLPYVAQIEGDVRHYTLPESDHPLVILQNAAENVLQHPETEVILGISSGGNQPAIATQLLFEALLGKKPFLSLIKFSLNSAKRVLNETFPDEKLHELLSLAHVKNAHVLITDDNVTRGATLEKLRQAITAFEPLSIHASVTEINHPSEVAYRVGNGIATKMLADLSHKDFTTAIRFYPTKIKDLEINQVLFSYYQPEINKKT